MEKVVEFASLRMQMRNIMGNSKAMETYFLGAMESLNDAVKSWINSLTMQTSHGIVLANMCGEVSKR